MSHLSRLAVVMAICAVAGAVPALAVEPMGATPGVGLSGSVQTPTGVVAAPPRMLPDPRQQTEAFVQELGGRLQAIGLLDEALAFDMLPGKAKEVKALINALYQAVNASNERLLAERLANIQRVAARAAAAMQGARPAPVAATASTVSTAGSPWPSVLSPTTEAVPEPTPMAAPAPQPAPAAPAPRPAIAAPSPAPMPKPKGLSAEERRRIILSTKPDLTGSPTGIGSGDIDRIFIDINRPVK